MDETCICTALRKAAAESTAYYDTILAPSGIKVTMFRLLRRIEKAGAVSITELSEIVGLDRSTLGRNLRVLEKQSLVNMGTATDGRERSVSLTDAGRAALHEALPLWHAAQQNLAQIVGDDTLELLTKVVRHMQNSSDQIGETK